MARFVWRLAVLTAVVSCLAATGVAQNDKGKKDQKLDGTLQGMQRALLLVRVGDKDWHVMLVPPSRKTENGAVVENPGTEVSVTGATSVDRLAPGAVVEFNADLDSKRNAAKEAVKAFKIVTFRPGVQLGVVADAATAAVDEPVKKRGRAPALADGPAQVTGRVQSVKNGKLQINIGTKKPIAVEVADGAEVTVDSAAVAIARQGDAITVEGWYTKEGQLYATKVDIKVTAAAGAAGATKRKPGKAAATKPADEPTEEKPAAEENAAPEKPAGKKPKKPADAAADEAAPGK